MRTLVEQNNHFNCLSINQLSPNRVCKMNLTHPSGNKLQHVIVQDPGLSALSCKRCSYHSLCPAHPIKDHIKGFLPDLASFISHTVSIFHFVHLYFMPSLLNGPSNESCHRIYAIIPFCTIIVDMQGFK